MRRIDAIEPFRVMQLLERAKKLEAQGKHIVHMEIGEPDFATPTPIIEAAKHALDHHNQFYTPSTGAPALQAAISQWYQSEYHVSIAPERILITPGTSGAFNLLYAVLLEHNEQVLLPDPGYPCQRNFIRLAGGIPVNIPVTPDTYYHLHASHLQQHWSTQTRAAVVINPGNPTGTLCSNAQMQGLAQACKSLGGMLISDEIYHGLHYDQKPQTALTWDDDVIVVNGFSKRWAMTGWRVGWTIVPQRMIEPCRRVMQNIFIAAPTLSQHAAITALGLSTELDVMRQAYDERRQYLLQALPKLGFGIVVKPQGAFYIYANVSRLCNDAKIFCHDLLESAGVAITPGEDFGSYQAKQHVRFSYATSLDDIKLGIDRIRHYLNH